jgi:Heparinase II/III-like protein
LGIVQQPEWGNFVCVVCKNPWSWSIYIIDFGRLVFRKFRTTFRQKIFGKKHRGLKLWPEWLDSKCVMQIDYQQDKFSLPLYTHLSQEYIGQVVARLDFDKDDPEAYFASHRWGDCLNAALEEDVVAKEAINDVLSWIINAPLKHDAAWEPYSTSERVANLVVMLAVHPTCWNELELDSKKLIGHFLVESVYWINSRLEYYGIEKTNNHILNNARALVIAGSVLGNEVVVERGLIIFTRMSEELFLSDGFLRERSSHYQFVITNWLMDTIYFAKSFPISLETGCQALERLMELSKKVAHATTLLINASDGLNTYIGDISPDHDPDTSILRLHYLYPDCVKKLNKFADIRCDDWLFVASRKHQLIACGMPIEYPFHYTSHGHSDLGSFIWGYDHCPILVDVGRSSYVSNDVTESQCGALGHNTLVVSGFAPLANSLFKNANWYPKPYSEAIVKFKQNSSSGFLLEHNGFSRIPGIGKHLRTVTIENNGLLIQDSLEGTGVVDIELYWHFAPGLMPEEESDSIVISSELKILIELDEQSKAVYKKQWKKFSYAEAYGDSQQSYMYQTNLKTTLPWIQTTKFKMMSCAE